MSALAVRHPYLHPQLSWPRVGAWSGTLSIHLVIAALLLAPTAAIQIVRRVTEQAPPPVVTIYPEHIIPVAPEPPLPTPAPHPVRTPARHETSVQQLAPPLDRQSDPIDNPPAPSKPIDIGSSGNTDTAPSAVTYGSSTRVPYPREAYVRHEQGTVTLRVVVGADGLVQSIEIATSSGSPRLDNAARDAVRKWVFKPALRNGIAHGATVLVPVAFSLTPL